MSTSGPDSDRERVPTADVRPMRQFGWLIVLAGLFTVGAAATVVGAAVLLDLEGVFLPEILLPLLLIAGLIALVIALAILVAVFHLFGLGDPHHPFGVPEGTLQVVIALSLIMIFAITSLYLRGSFDTETVTARGLTAEQVAQIPGTEIVATTPNTDNTNLFDVDRRVPVDEDAKDFSNQLLTILGTLVGAVAGFYFGAKSVETGVSAGGGLAPGNTSPPLIGGQPRPGEMLRAEPGSWTGSPPPSYDCQWQRKKPTDPDWSNIPGANASTYVVAPEDEGQTIRVAVTATNAAGTQTAYSAEMTVVLQTLAPPSGGIEIDGSPQVSEELRATHADWTGSPPPLLTYQWQRKKPTDPDWSDIPGANAATYLIAPEDEGQTIRVAVTATSVAGTQTAYSAERQVIPEAPTKP